MNKVPRTMFEARKVAEPNINKVNISFKVSLFFFSIRKTKRVCLYSLFRHKGSVNEDLSLLL